MNNYLLSFLLYNIHLFFYSCLYKYLIAQFILSFRLYDIFTFVIFYLLFLFYIYIYIKSIIEMNINCIILILNNLQNLDLYKMLRI